MPSQTTLNVSLTPELKALIGAKIASGHYRSASEVVRAALRLMVETSPGSNQTPEPCDHLARQRSEQQLAAFFEQTAAAMAQADLTGRLMRVNDQYCAIAGRTREELLQLRVQDITHPDDLPSNVDLLARAAASGKPFEIEKRYLRPDGSVVWARNAVSPVRNASGEIEATVAVCVDITERKRDEEALRRSEALKSAMLETALDAVITISGESQIAEWNAAAERIFGYPAGAVLGRDLAELIIPPELRERHHSGMAQYLATGHGPVLGKRIELEAIRSNGSRLPVEVAISATHVHGQPLFTAYLRDISERKQTEATLRDREQRLRSTYEHAFVGIAEVDPDGCFLRVNEQFCALTGYERQELLARTMWQITHPDDRGTDLEQFARQMAGDLDLYTLEKRFLHKDGQTSWVELSASRVDDASGRPLYGVRVVRDVTERKRWEEHQRLLMNELNHRVKNTLATVQSIASQSLRNTSSREEARTAIESRLFALSRAHDVLTRENWEGAGLGEIVMQAMEPFRVHGESRIQCSGPDVRISPRMALATAMTLQELATNAVKYGALSNEAGEVGIRWMLEEAGGAAFRLRLRWEESGGPVVEAPSRRGFGTRLIERGLSADLGGNVSIAFAPNGVVCSVDALLSHRERTEADRAA